MVLNIKTHTTGQAVENEPVEWLSPTEKYILNPIHGVDHYERERDIYIPYPIHGVDHYGREGGIYTEPHPRSGSLWKRRGHIYRTPSTGWIRVEEKGAYILHLFHGEDQYGRGWEEYRSQRWWLTTKKHSLMDTAGKGHI